MASSSPAAIPVAPSAAPVARWWRVAAVLVVLFAALAVASTWHVFNHTSDEGVHLVTGLEWFEVGRYALEPQHPLLSRVAIALGPWLDGTRLEGYRNIWLEGNTVLYRGARGYDRTLTLARAGIIPFFLAAALVVWAWARRSVGDEAPNDDRVGALAVLLFATTPAVLAHAGLATTDMALTATLTGALFAGTRWLDRPTLARAIIFGLAAGLAILSKFSAIPYLAAAAATVGVLRLVAAWRATRAARSAGDERAPSELEPDTASRGSSLAAHSAIPWRRLLLTAPVVGLVTLFALLLAYGFSVAHWRGIPLPIPNEIKLGIYQVRVHNSVGEGDAFLLGRWSRTGFWYYFPVAFAVKTPIPFLALAAVGAAATLQQLRRGNWRPVAPLAAAVGVLAFAMTANINIGVRHVLPMYALLAIIGAHGVVALWRTTRDRRALRAVAPALLVWQLAAPLTAHPDHLAWFNAFAGPRPDNVLLDSNLDWGQDLYRLRDTVRARGIPSLAIAYFGTANPARHVPGRLRRLQPFERTTGWVAVSQMVYHGLPPGRIRATTPQGYRWLDAYGPPIHVGKSILLFHVPERAAVQGSPTRPAPPGTSRPGR